MGRLFISSVSLSCLLSSLAKPEELLHRGLKLGWVIPGHRVTCLSNCTGQMLCYLSYSRYKIAKTVMEEKRVVTCFLEHNKKILLLRMSERVGTYKGRWAGISGYIEEGNTLYEQALEEIREETGLSGEDIELAKEGKLLEVGDEQMGRKWIVYPYHFQVMKPEKSRLIGSILS